MSLLAIDPGTTESAYLVASGPACDFRLVGMAIAPNRSLLEFCRALEPDQVAVEMIASFGMPVGREVFETCLFIGRLQEIFGCRGIPARLIYRRDIKMFLCGSARAKDGNIRAALIDKYGPPGTKKSPGRLYGISSHLWAALAVADYALNNPEIETER